jgi:hypothetical protein
LTIESFLGSNFYYYYKTRNVIFTVGGTDLNSEVFPRFPTCFSISGDPLFYPKKEIHALFPKQGNRLFDPYVE